MAPQLVDLHPLLRNLTWKDFDPSINCTWAGRLLGQWWRWDLDDEYEGTSSYLISSFAWACSPVPLINVTRGQIVDWDIYQDITLSVLMNRTEEACFRDFCQHLEWEGNSDLAGIGVFAAYVIQTVLTMVFLITYLCQTVNDRKSGRRRKNQQPATTWKFLDQCLGIFWISSFYFSLCMLVASLSITYLSNNPQHAVYFSFLGSTFSVTVLGTLWPWYQSRCTHPHLALTGFSLLSTLVAAISFSYSFRRTTWETRFELSCFYEIAKHSKVSQLLTVPITTLCALGIWLGFCFWFERLVIKPQRSLVGRLARGIVSVTSFILLWVCLAYFVQLRNATSYLIGSSYAENEWGFGQIPAVVAWIPTFAEFIKAWTCELSPILPLHSATSIRDLVSFHSMPGYKPISGG
ncbi:hypothetical protein V8F06_009470 [Rhypophila decipiens]